MATLNTKGALAAFVGVSGIALIALGSLKGASAWTPAGLIRLLPTVVSVDAVILFVFSAWVWRWRILRNWLVLVPDLRGTWRGEVQSTYVDPETGLQASPIAVIATVEQSLFSVSCVFITAEMTSHSYAAGFHIDRQQQVLQFCYSYTSRTDPRVRSRSEMHDGTQVLDIIEDEPPRLEGAYWTQRKTTGFVRLVRQSRRLIPPIDRSYLAHPLSSPSRRGEPPDKRPEDHLTQRPKQEKEPAE